MSMYYSVMGCMLSAQSHHPSVRPSPDGSLRTNTCISFFLVNPLYPQLSTSRRQSVFTNTSRLMLAVYPPPRPTISSARWTISKMLHTLCLPSKATLVLGLLSAISSVSKILHILCLAFHSHSYLSISLPSSNNVNDSCNCAYNPKHLIPNAKYPS